jgi:ADP-ribosyl-[dinitrogen reductase] hydrolase
LEVTKQDRFRGALLGLACGDAVGTTVEFQARGGFAPVTDMVGGGPFRLAPGQWTDDTSMALCLATSLVEQGGFDAADQMARYCRWWHEGYLSSNGRCFDIGHTVNTALERFERTGEACAGSTDPHTAGNGSIMRLSPVAICYHRDLTECMEQAAQSSRTTHGAAECLDACRLLAALLHAAFAGGQRADVLRAGEDPAVLRALTAPKILALAQGEWRGARRAEIRGTGYVVASLEAALWSVSSTETFRDAILLAANLGDAADTTAAVCGQIAGACYGESGIPAEWLERLTLADEMRDLADRLAATLAK